MTMQAHVRPCLWMRRALPRLVDDTLRGPLKWLASEHMKRCSVCRKAYAALQRLGARLKEAATPREEPRLSEERWSELGRQLDEEVPSDRAGPPGV